MWRKGTWRMCMLNGCSLAISAVCVCDCVESRIHFSIIRDCWNRPNGDQPDEDTAKENKYFLSLVLNGRTEIQSIWKIINHNNDVGIHIPIMKRMNGKEADNVVNEKWINKQQQNSNAHMQLSIHRFRFLSDGRFLSWLTEKKFCATHTHSTDRCRCEEVLF